MKRWFRVVLCLLSLCLLAGCSGKTPDFLDYDMDAVRIYSSIGGEVTDSQQSYYGFPLVKTLSAREQEKLISTFDGWNREKARLGKEETPNLYFDVYVRFGQGVVMGMRLSADRDTRGCIVENNTIEYYELPEAFVQQILQLISTQGS